MPMMDYEISILENCRTVIEDLYYDGELKVKSEFLKAFLDTIPFPVYYKDINGKYLGCNKAFEHFIGKNREDLISKEVMAAWPKQVAVKYEKKYGEIFETPGIQIYQSQIKLPDGSNREVIFYKTKFSDTFGKTAGIVGAIQDITWLIQAINLFNDGKKDLRSFAPFYTESVILIDSSGIILDANEVAAHRLKTTLEMFKGKNIYDFFPPELLEKHRKILSEVIANGRPEYFEDRHDGRAFFTAIYPLFNKDGITDRLVIFGMDIAAANTEQNELINYEELYRSVIEASFDGYLYINLDGFIIEANEQYCTISGYTREELLRMHISDLEANENYEQTVAHICKIIESGKDRFVTKHRTKSGEILDFEVNTTYSEIKIPGFFSFFRDITKHKQTEERKQHLEKVLVSIRKISKAIIYSSDAYTLIEQACNCLTETLGYQDALIVLIDENNSVISTAISGNESKCKDSQKQLECGILPFCMISALQKDGIIVTERINPQCADCSLCGHPSMSIMTSKLQCDGKTYGILAVWIPSCFAYDKEEQELFRGITDDLGFALKKKLT